MKGQSFSIYEMYYKTFKYSGFLSTKTMLYLHRHNYLTENIH